MPLIKHTPNTSNTAEAVKPEATQVKEGNTIPPSAQAAPKPATIDPYNKALDKPAYTGGRSKTSSDTMSKEEWAAKDRRIGRAGLYQAALQSVGAMQFCASNNLEDYLKVVRRVAEDGLKFVNEQEG